MQLSTEHGWSSSDVTNPVGVDGRVNEIDSHWVYVIWSHNNVRNAYHRTDSDLIKQN